MAAFPKKGYTIWDFESHYRPVSMTGRPDGSIRSSRSDATDTQDLASDTNHDGHAGGSVRIVQEREN